MSSSSSARRSSTLPPARGRIFFMRPNNSNRNSSTLPASASRQQKPVRVLTKEQIREFDKIKNFLRKEFAKADTEEVKAALRKDYI